MYLRNGRKLCLIFGAIEVRTLFSFLANILCIIVIMLIVCPGALLPLLAPGQRPKKCSVLSQTNLCKLCYGNFINLIIEKKENDPFGSNSRI